MQRTCAEWLPILAKRHDEAAPRISSLKGYASGNAPLPQGEAGTREAWQAFQRLSRLNLGGLIVYSATERMRCAGVVVGEENEPAQARVERIMRDNRWSTAMAESLGWAVSYGLSYLMAARDEAGRAVITAESPEFVTSAADPLRPWRLRAALKVWRDPDDGFDHAFIWNGQERQHFVASSRGKQGETITRVQDASWQPTGEPVEVGAVPLVCLQPTEDGLGAIEPHSDVIDRVHTGILNRLVIQAMQAFRQRALKRSKGESAYQEVDENGNPIDIDSFFSAAPGAIWDLPEGIDIWESQATDIRPLLDASKDDLRDLAAVSRTPLSVLNPEGANQSAEGAAFAREGLVYRVQGYLDRVQPALELVLVRALRIEAADLLAEEETLTVLFTPPQRVSESERMAALVQAKAADVPWRTRMITVGGFSAAEVDRMEIERAQEQLLGLSLMEGGGFGTNPEPSTSPSAAA